MYSELDLDLIHCVGASRGSAYLSKHCGALIQSKLTLAFSLCLRVELWSLYFSRFGQNRLRFNSLSEQALWSSDTEQADFAQAGFLSLSLSPGAWSLYFSKTGSPDQSGADSHNKCLGFLFVFVSGTSSGALEYVLFQIW